MLTNVRLKHGSSEDTYNGNPCFSFQFQLAACIYLYGTTENLKCPVYVFTTMCISVCVWGHDVSVCASVSRSICFTPHPF